MRIPSSAYPPASRLPRPARTPYNPHFPIHFAVKAERIRLYVPDAAFEIVIPQDHQDENFSPQPPGFECWTPSQPLCQSQFRLPVAPKLPCIHRP